MIGKSNGLKYIIYQAPAIVCNFKPTNDPAGIIFIGFRD